MAESVMMDKIAQREGSIFRDQDQKLMKALVFRGKQRRCTVNIRGREEDLGCGTEEGQVCSMQTKM